MGYNKKYTEFTYVSEKLCTSCQVVKSREEFQKDSYNKNGLQAKCRTCTKIHTDAYKLAHPEYFKIKGLEKYYSLDREKHNKERYQQYRKAYLIRRKEYSETVRGRLMNLLSAAKKRATKSSKSFEIDIDWLLDQYNLQDGRCALTDIKLEFTTSPNGERFFNPFTPSLDKINPAGGYTKENTRLVCTMINLALNKFGEDTFEKLAIAFLNKRKQKHG